MSGATKQEEIDILEKGRKKSDDTTRRCINQLKDMGARLSCLNIQRKFARCLSLY